MYYSQYQQDQYLYENFFRDKTDGFFVDIGSHDGVCISNTKFFEEIGWKGICVEANPSVFEKLRKNRTCDCINAAINDKSGDVDFLVCEGYTEMLSGILDKYNPTHLNRVNQEIQVYGGKKEIVKVKGLVFDEICSLTQKIDILFIDTEGSEYDILKTIDFNKYEIEFVVFENPYYDHDFESLLKNYNLVQRLTIDDIYKRKSI